ncbi:hypothetical protein HDV00_010720 [Rhizophlyctis rosea]|nr:hypothetical protein HDV00_010720 [Rhizophlyctis rosea]
MTYLQPIFEIVPQDVTVHIISQLPNPVPTFRTCKALRALTTNEELRTAWIHNIYNPLQIGSSPQAWRQKIEPQTYDKALLCPKVALKLMEKVRGVDVYTDLNRWHPIVGLLERAAWWPDRRDDDDDVEDILAAANTGTTPLPSTTTHMCQTTPSDVASYLYNNFHITDHPTFESLISLAPPALRHTIMLSMTTNDLPFPHCSSIKQYGRRSISQLITTSLLHSDDLPTFRHLLRYRDPARVREDVVDFHLSKQVLLAGALGRSEIVLFILGHHLTPPKLKQIMFLAVLLGGHMDLVRRCQDEMGYGIQDVDLDEWNVSQRLAKTLKRGPDEAFEYLMGAERVKTWMQRSPKILECLKGWKGDVEVTQKFPASSCALISMSFR